MGCGRRWRRKFQSAEIIILFIEIVNLMPAPQSAVDGPRGALIWAASLANRPNLQRTRQMRRRAGRPDGKITRGRPNQNPLWRPVSDAPPRKGGAKHPARGADCADFSSNFIKVIQCVEWRMGVLWWDFWKNGVDVSVKVGL